MSKLNNRNRFDFPDTDIHWHDARKAELMGCGGCAFRSQCGGLRVGASLFNCMTYCRCPDPTACDNVCPGNMPHLVARIHEVDGFDLKAPRIARVEVKDFPRSVPIVYHGSARERPLRTPAAALSLYEVLDRRTGWPKFQSRKDLLAAFKLDDRTRLILCGTDVDQPLERWWGVHRADQIAPLKAIGIDLISTPNFSLFDDVPRTDNLYNMKRIVKSWHTIQSAGIACAVHINARTDYDWDKWAQFLLEHPEVEHVAFEFGTGAGRSPRAPWHVEHLCGLAKRVSQRLRLVVRGGLPYLATLSEAFHRVSYLDTSSFIRAQHRQRAVIENGRLHWRFRPTSTGRPIDSILSANIDVTKQFVQGTLQMPLGLERSRK